jgi:hypothetical protein
VATLPFAAAWLAIYISTRRLWPLRDAGQVTAMWGYALVGVTVLAKGPPGLAVVGLTIALTVAVTGRWRWLLRVRLVEGAVVVLLVAGPWHLAMLLCDGAPWVNEYFGLHWLARATSGVHGDRGGFLYVFEQLGTGMWPWIGLLPVSLAAGLARSRVRSPRDVLCAAAVLWAVVGFAFFAIVETKFHHYILPVLPALAILIGLWLDQRTRPSAGLLLWGVGMVAGIAVALAIEHKQLIELFIYRHDRPWPEAIGLRSELLGFGAIAVLALGALWWSRRRAIRVVIACAAVFALWCTHRYMNVAAPHWGQRELHRVYYDKRAVHSVVVSDTPPAVLRVDVAVGVDLPIGRQLVVREQGGNSHRATVVLSWPTGVWLSVEGAAGTRPPARVVIDADRLIAWQLFWRGENFWSGGEIYGATPESRTAFKELDNRAFIDYLREHGIAGRRYWVITEASRAKGLRLSVPNASRASVRIEHDESNKFTLLSFVLSPW